MITRTNKISNCYHPSHLPLLRGGCRVKGVEIGVGVGWGGEQLAVLVLSLPSKGLASEMMVKN